MTQEIALAMIVKNEAHVIDRCFNSVLPHVQHAVINDNGSTDRTPEILAARQVQTLHTAWWDFATNRNMALQAAEQYGGYVLCGVDADEELVVPAGWTWPTLTADAYYIWCHYHTLRYKRLALVRANAGFQWAGVIHEALVNAHNYTADTLPDVYLQVHSDGARARDPNTAKHDLDTLRAATAADPGNARYQFYLAQTLKDLGRFAEARTEYEARVLMPGWPEETTYAKYMVGVLCVLLGDSDPVPHLIMAYSWNPRRAEPLVTLAQYYRDCGMFAPAALFAYQATQLPVPEDALFVDSSVYAWQAASELIISAFYVPSLYHLGAAAARAINIAAVPYPQRVQVEANCAFYTRQ